MVENSGFKGSGFRVEGFSPVEPIYGVEGPQGGQRGEGGNEVDRDGASLKPKKKENNDRRHSLGQKRTPPLRLVPPVCVRLREKNLFFSPPFEFKHSLFLCFHVRSWFGEGAENFVRSEMWGESTM